MSASSAVTVMGERRLRKLGEQLASQPCAEQPQSLSGSLTARQLAQYRSDGVLINVPAVSPTAAAELLAHVEAYEAETGLAAPLYDPTFSITVWRLYGGAKVLVI